MGILGFEPRAFRLTEVANWIRDAPRGLAPLATSPETGRSTGLNYMPNGAYSELNA